MAPNTPNIPLIPVQSSQIEAIGHDGVSTLAIRFKGRSDGKPGSLYHYQNFPTVEFEALKNAESIGSHFYKHVKPFADLYPYTRINETVEA